jgi:uncharacterized membrane protein
MLLRSEASCHLDGFPRQVMDVKGKILSAQGSDYDLLFPLQALILLFPFALLAVHYRFGREKRYTVPKTLSYVPSKRKPWLVNLVFKGDAFDFDKDGFYATLLDLHRRGVVEIDSVTGTRIKLLQPEESGEDDYEQKVLNFLRSNSTKGVFNARAFEDNIKNLQKSRDTARLQEMHETMDGLLRYTNHDAAYEFVARRSLRCFGGIHFRPRDMLIILYVAVFIFIVLGKFSILSNPLVVALLILLVQAFGCGLCPLCPLGKVEARLLQGEAGVGCLPGFFVRLCHDKKVCARGSGSLEGMAGLRHGPGGG